MPVVINEFDAIAEAAPPAASTGAGGGGTPKPLKPRALRSPLERIARRGARVWAH